ncbi:type IV toxin-antitoxin system AbiEi family antitoxin domain-containing protein [Tsukamurella soli]|uniref:AbiEi antitoxin N-terminal domain-containing protein n=1 Tax=Tsukamurella soli TaxID=644556 RepID=A0ABP8JVI8_9ACTN
MGDFASEGRLARLLGENDGVITRRAALAIGMKSSAIDRRVAAKLWQTLAPGVYLSTAHPLTDAVCWTPL